jgi:hypothetical protein
MPTATSTNPAAGKKQQPPPSIRERAEQYRQHARTAHTYTRGVQHQAAPLAAMGLLVAASAALNAAKQASAADAEILAGTAAVSIVIAVVAAVVLKHRLDDRRMLHRAVGFLAMAAGWLTWTTANGLTVNAAAVLAAVGSLLSLHWWRMHRIPNRVPARPVPNTPTAKQADEYADLWDTRIGNSGDLAGTHLESHESIDAGERYVLKLVPGKHTYTQVLGMLERIRSGLDLKPDEDLIVERHPVLAASCLQLTIVTRSPIKESVQWPGPSAFNPATGCVALGPYTDGEGVASWRAYTDNSFWGGFLTGGTGSGKSRMIESIAMSLAASETHPTVVWFIDGDEGASSALLVDHADHKALDEELLQARDILTGALGVMKLRRAENVANKWEGFTPTEDRPGILIIIDECHIVFAHDDLRKMAAEIARRGRKVGVAIIGATQIATLDAFGGAGKEHTDALRSSLRAGNGVILRSNTNSTKDVFKVDVDPSQFPALPGYGYYVASKDSGARTAPFRGYYVTDELKDDWPHRIYWRSLTDGEGNAYTLAAGTDYAERGTLADESREEALAWIEAVKSGRAMPAEARLRTTGRFVPPAQQPAFNVPAIPVWDPEVFAPARKIRPRDELHRSHAAVLAQLQQGVNRTGQIADAIGLSERQTYNLLQELITEFALVEATEVQGRYRLVTEPASA